MPKETATQAKEKSQAMHEIPTDLSREGVAEITTALRRLLADTFALYLKTKNFHVTPEVAWEPYDFRNRPDLGLETGGAPSLAPAH